MYRTLLLVVVGCVAGTLLNAQNTAFRGDADAADQLEAAQRSVENLLLVEEIEDAGFELDVLEGFEEEWEEDIWVDAASDELDANYVDPLETARFDLDEIQESDIVEADMEEGEEWLDLEASEEDLELVSEDLEEEMPMRGEESTMSFDDTDLEAALEWDEETESAELNWWESDASEWEDIIDEIDLEGEYFEEEDIDLLEEMFEMG